MQEIGRGLIYLGVVLILVGGVILFLAKVKYFGKLPGDIYIKRENFTFYFPIVTCLIISLIISLILYFIKK
jgi:hypothetical protein